VKKRSLSDSEQKLWQAFVAEVRRVPPAGTLPPPLPPGKVTLRARPHAPPLPEDAFSLTGKEITIGDITALDRRNARRLSRGEMPPEAILDLHGHTLAVAEQKLVQFILQQQQQGKRRLLVITGKGKPGSPSAIREAMPRWLAMPALRPWLLAATEAAPHEGGSGAFYVLLRRSRATDSEGHR
jgi:DNA-nicking Smr family endonuclease